MNRPSRRSMLAVAALLPAMAAALMSCATAGGRASSQPVPARAPAQPAWAEADYARFDFKTFETFAPAQQQLDPGRIDWPLLNAAVFYETNRQRALNGRTPFRHSAPLERSAWEHSKDMVRLNFFAHESPVPGKAEMGTRIKLVGYTYSHAAENIAIGFVLAYEPGKPVQTPGRPGGAFRYPGRGDIPNHTYVSAAQALLDAWMHSPGHRANILNADLQELGAGGAVFLEDRVWYKLKFTQNFGTPR